MTDTIAQPGGRIADYETPMQTGLVQFSSVDRMIAAIPDMSGR